MQIFRGDMDLPVNYETLHYTQRRAVREEYVRLQKGKCCHCGAPLTGPAAEHILKKVIMKSLFPENFFKYPVHLHHSHETGMTIGAIHNYCNAVLWQYHGE